MFAIEGLGDVATSPPILQVGAPGKPVVTAAPYGLFPYWLGLPDPAKAPDYYRWQTLPGMAPSRIPPPEGSYSTIAAGKDAMNARNAGVQAAVAATPPPVPNFAQLFSTPPLLPVPSTTPFATSAAQMGISPALSPFNWGPRALPDDTQWWQNPLVWVAGGTALVLGAILLAPRRK